MKWGHAGFIVLAIVLAGCTQVLSDPSPEQQLQQTLAESQDSSYLVNYDLSVSSLDSVDVVNQLELGSYQKQYKLTVTINAFGSPINYGIYWNEDSWAVCTESDELECQAGARDAVNESLDDVTSNVTDILEDDAVEVTHEGSKDIAERSCEQFNIKFDEEAKEELMERNGTIPDDRLSTAKSLLQSETGQEIASSNMTLSLCLDSEKGYPAQLSASTAQETEIAGKQVTDIFTLNASSHDDASPSDVEVPVAATVTAQCDPFEAEVYSIRHEGEATLTINENDTETVMMEPGSSQTINLSEYEQTESDEYSYLGVENTVTIDAGGTRDSASCRSSAETEPSIGSTDAFSLN